MQTKLWLVVFLWIVIFFLEFYFIYFFYFIWKFKITIYRNIRFKIELNVIKCKICSLKISLLFCDQCLHSWILICLFYLYFLWLFCSLEMKDYLVLFVQGFWLLQKQKLFDPSLYRVLHSCLHSIEIVPHSNQSVNGFPLQLALSFLLHDCISVPILQCIAKSMCSCTCVAASTSFCYFSLCVTS